ncbi:MAG: TIGR00282 family metallophosphoesterase [Candidatus Eisenbacteria bacterium]
MRVLFVSDVMGAAGRTALEALPSLVADLHADYVIANGENAAGGFGITRPIADELFEIGVNLITGGNHLWDRKEIGELLADVREVLRPANYPPGVPGSGYGIFETKRGEKIAVLNLQGRVFMKELDCPFRCAAAAVEILRKETPVIVVDVHAEATSEKVAMGWFLDGKVSAVIGTHTHVQTADERVLPKGTGYITDAGMTGSFDSVIGIDKKAGISRFLTQMPVRLVPAEGDLRVNGVVVDIESSTGTCTSIQRLSVPVDCEGNA